MILELAVMFCFPAAMCFAASMDFFTMTIPNRISLFLLVLFFLLVPFLGFGMQEILTHVLAGVLMFALGFFLFSLGVIGGGDAKIFAVASLWLGFEHLLTFMLITSILGGLMTLCFVFVRQMPLPFFLSNQGWALRLHDVKSGIPYGVALGFAALTVYPNSIWMKNISF